MLPIFKKSAPSGEVRGAVRKTVEVRSVDIDVEVEVDLQVLQDPHGLAEIVGVQAVEMPFDFPSDPFAQVPQPLE